MFALTKKVLDTIDRWHKRAYGVNMIISLIFTVLLFLSVDSLFKAGLSIRVLPVLSSILLWLINMLISGNNDGDKMEKTFLPFWITFLPVLPFAFIVDIIKWFGQSICKAARAVGSWVWGKIVARKMEKSSFNLIRDGHNPEKIEPITLRGGLRQVITPALVTKGAIEFITDQIGRKKMIDGPDGEEGVIVPEYRISEDGERATAMVTYRLIKDSQVHANVKRDEVHFRYFVLAFNIDRVKGTLETGVLEEGTESPSAKVLDDAAESLWGEQIQRDLDKFKSFDAKLHQFRAERQIDPATSPVQQADGTLS